ncbi:site-specific integrase [Elizabethkingia anophelis]|nr:site-specific integrase [Elizabethkingia anophelis]MCT4015676.1 site-specific integrase [Elizabethkingia anophelis]MCT4019336.1 site-specific integrase [Elizabethkingia anophelis]MDV3609065.1 transposase [Elizabethkingia anophelis]MDV3696430.1 transposase [Elizabethkingia anophelis]
MKIYLRVRKGQLSKINQKKGKVRMNSLYLLFYDNENRRRWTEFLKLYVYDKPQSFIEKNHNKETNLLAESIRSQKILEFQSRQHGFVSSTSGRVGFLEYFSKMVEKKYEVDGTYGNWDSTLKHLKTYCKGMDIQISKVDEVFLEGFKDYLLKENISKRGSKLSRNSALSYFNKVRACLKEAYRNKIIVENPTTRVKTIKEEETDRQYLTLEEIQQLVKTECEYPILKNAFLFSCLTGLRFSDIKELRWKNLSYDSENGWILKFTQKKTKGVENLPISKQSIKILGERGNDDERIFENLVYSCYHNKKLHKWVEKAGIDKHITFHCARHSFATLQLTMNTDIYTVSKLLGHRFVKTTEIYAKVIDKKKINAVSRIPDIFVGR